jgi:hypothetical protein
MKKFTFTLLILLQAICAIAQTTTVNIGQSTGMLDSTFVIQSGAPVTLNASNHPGAGPYYNADIYVCQGATLTYDFMLGTSNIATFYLDENATLIFTTMAAGTMANFYMKNNSSIQLPVGMTLYAYMKREPNAQVAGLPISYMSDTVFNTISFTFNGWANPCSPTTIQTVQSVTEYISFQNPIQSNGVRFSNSLTKPTEIVLYNTIGQQLSKQTILPNQSTLTMPYSTGLVYYTLSDQGRFLQSGKLIIQ